MNSTQLFFILFWQKKNQLFRLYLLYFLIWYVFALPAVLFQDSYSTIIESSEGDLLAAHIAEDGQWRFPESDTLPEKLKICLLEFEDKNFYHHLGISLTGILRAIKQNFSSGQIVSGGSTITQQVIRMMRKNPPRTYSEKIYEMILATRLELRFSKDEILAQYASHAPFGNNVVGLNAAAWRYFGRRPEQLSWSENATLAVLPNAPGLIYPGKNHQKLMAKRNRLLKRLLVAKKIKPIDYALAIAEEIPPAPLDLPRMAPHLLQNQLLKSPSGTKFESTLEAKNQDMVMDVLREHALPLQENKIMNAAAMVTHIETGEVIAYVGNMDANDEENSGAVDCLMASRSSGSILKPLLFAKSMQDGLLTPDMLLSDLPSQFGNFSPNNFSGQFEGAVAAKKALSRSLNIPMVHLLKQYGMSKFHYDLKQMGFTTLKKPAKHYGLSLILGGAEVTPWDVSQVYVKMAQKLKTNRILGIQLNRNQSQAKNEHFPMSKAVIFNTFEALVDVVRPDEENNWRAFESSQKIAWKTGTSFGFRDAWAVGVSGEYCVTVWVGNADGEGRPGLTGVRAAAPILFDIFRQLPKGQWFEEPKTGYKKLKICKESGHKANKNCPNGIWKQLPENCAQSLACHYHRAVHLDETETYRVSSACLETYKMRNKIWFVLPPMMEQYYRPNHPEYSNLPPFSPGCISNSIENTLGLLYPKKDARIFLPRQFTGERGSTVFEASHSQKEMTLFWHIDERYLGSTTGMHQMTVQPDAGKHLLTIVDENGITLQQSFSIIQ